MLIAGMCDTLPHIPDDVDVIGIDYGAYVCYQQKQPMVAAIGDFDSIDSNMYDILKMNTKLISLPCEKNETDTEVAIQYAIQQRYETIYVYGAFGGRMDHELANLYLLMHRRLPIILMNETNRMRILSTGVYQVKKEYTYLSFFALENSCLSERGVRYPIEKQELTPMDIYAVSNEIVEEHAEIEVHSGCVVMVEANDKKSSV